MTIRIAGILCIILMIGGCGPDWNSRIMDEASILNEDQREVLIDRIKAIENQYGAQVAILISKDLGDTDLEFYARGKMLETQLGGKDISKGVIISTVMSSQVIRIDRGSNFKDILSDQVNNRIISLAIAPNFGNNQYYAGLDEGLQMIVGILETESLLHGKTKN